MRFRKYYFTLLLMAGFGCSQSKNVAAQPKAAVANTIHEVFIFKWCKDGDTNIKRSIKIDSLGNVIIKGQNALEKVDMDSFTKNIGNFIKGENVQKIPGDNKMPEVARIPEKDRQSIYVSVVMTNDYIYEKAMRNKTHYSWSKFDLDKFENDYALFKYLDAKDVTMLKRFLE